MGRIDICNRQNRKNREMMMMKMSPFITSTNSCLLSALLFLACTALPPAAGASEDWNYDTMSSKGPRFWSKDFPSCNVVNNPDQSPIRLKASDTFYGFHVTKPVNFIAPAKPGQFLLKNDGRKLKLILPDNYFVEGGSLPSDCAPTSSSSSSSGSGSVQFKVAEIHFVFSKHDEPGVEHALADRDHLSFPLEVQAFAFDHKKHKSIDKALKDNSGKAVMAVAMLQRLSISRNYDLEPVISKLDGAARPGDEVKIAAFDLNDFLPVKAQRDQFFTYDGSLPFPPCSAGVSWTVMAATSTVSENQMEAFRKKVFRFPKSTNQTDKLAGNYRGLQRISKRHVIRSSALKNFGNGASSIFTSSSTPSSALFFSLLLIVSSLIPRFSLWN